MRHINFSSLSFNPHVFVLLIVVQKQCLVSILEFWNFLLWNDNKNCGQFCLRIVKIDKGSLLYCRSIHKHFKICLQVTFAWFSRECSQFVFNWCCFVSLFLQSIRTLFFWKLYLSTKSFQRFIHLEPNLIPLESFDVFLHCDLFVCLTSFCAGLNFQFQICF